MGAAQPSPVAPPPSMLPMRSDLQRPAEYFPAPAAVEYYQQPQHQPMHAMPAPAPAPTRSSAADAAADHLGPRAFKTWVQDAPHAGGAPPVAAAASRPPPEPTASAEADTERQVDSMVENLKLRFKQSGVTLPLEKHAGCVYRLGSRKLSLNIRNARLMVLVGCGYCDFLEYLSKATL